MRGMLHWSTKTTAVPLDCTHYEEKKHYDVSDFTLDVVCPICKKMSRVTRKNDYYYGGAWKGKRCGWCKSSTISSSVLFECQHCNCVVSADVVVRADVDIHDPHNVACINMYKQREKK